MREAVTIDTIEQLIDSLYFSQLNSIVEEQFLSHKERVLSTTKKMLSTLIGDNEYVLFCQYVPFKGIEKLEAIYQQKIADLEELKKSILKTAFEGEL